MNTYVVYLRGINVGGKNKIKMADLRTVLTDLGYVNVKTYIQSGNVVLQSNLDSDSIQLEIVGLLLNIFDIDSARLKVLALIYSVYQSIIEDAPQAFGVSDTEEDYRYDVLFPVNISVEEAMQELPIMEDVDAAWMGKYAIYYRRPGPSHPAYTKSGLNRLPKKAVYQSLTIRNWKTTVKMWDMLDDN